MQMHTGTGDLLEAPTEALGAGLGGLPWPEVRARILAALAPIEDLDVWLWEPGFTPHKGS